MKMAGIVTAIKRIPPRLFMIGGKRAIPLRMTINPPTMQTKKNAIAIAMAIAAKPIRP
ncbi:MAG: hypothetical protein Q8M76_05235 [Spirochaetaceae bacterium]|nr:hypothetical protein [Spirochaetaceae bacterium]